MNYWLIKTEPSIYSIDDLKCDKKEHWDGVRNYQARNFMKNDMRIGDTVLFYHSNLKPSGVVGLARVCKEGYPDFTSWDKKSKYYDPKSTKENPRWFMVDVCFVEKFNRIISLEELKENKKLKNMMLTQKGSRLSVQPVLKNEFEEIINIKNSEK